MNLLLTTFFDILLFIIFSLILIQIWNIYYLYTNTLTTPVILFNETKITKKPVLTESITHGLVFILLICFMVLHFIFISLGSNTTAFWNVLYTSHNTNIYFYVLIFIVSALLILGSLTVKHNITVTMEYFIFIVLLGLSGYLLISSTNLFVSIFVLELTALLIFAKFTVTKLLYPKSRISTPNSTVFLNQFSYGLFNSLFFQFWANFVSSVFLFFSLINLHYTFGTSNFYLLNYFSSVIYTTSYVPDIFLMFIYIVLLLGFFIKLGLSPYQFFKIETYKGLPLYVIIVYTTVYLIIYIYFFVLLLLQNLSNIRLLVGVFLMITIFLSFLYLVSLLFDTKNFKAFLSYSTLITISNIFIAIILV